MGLFRCRRRVVLVVQVIKVVKECLLMVVAMFSIMSMVISLKFLENMFLLFVLLVEALMASSGEFFKIMNFIDILLLRVTLFSKILS